MRVLFPAPFGPRRPKHSPRSTTRSTCSRAWTVGPRRVRNSRERSEVWMAALSTPLSAKELLEGFLDRIRHGVLVRRGVAWRGSGCGRSRAVRRGARAVRLRLPAPAQDLAQPLLEELASRGLDQPGRLHRDLGRERGAGDPDLDRDPSVLVARIARDLG